MSNIERKQGKVGRPRKDEVRVAEGSPRRRRRGSVGGWRDKLPVKWLDPEYHYRWVQGYDEGSYNILNAMDIGYTFVDAETHSYGENQVYKPESGSSIVRCPAGQDGGYLFLMRIPKAYYEEDLDDKRERILEIESSTTRRYQQEGGVYGEIKLNNSVGQDKGF